MGDPRGFMKHERKVSGYAPVADRLKQLHRDEPKRYATIWESLAPFIKIGAMEDEKFADQVTDLILFRTTAPAQEPDAVTQFDMEASRVSLALLQQEALAAELLQMSLAKE